MLCPSWPRLLCLRVVLDLGQPEDHLLTRAGKHHVLGVELDALDGFAVLRVEHGHLVAFLHVPDVNLAV